MDLFTQSAWLIPAFPLLAFLVQLSLGRSYRMAGILVGCVGSLLSLVMSLLISMERIRPGAVDYSGSFEWVRLGGYSLRIGYEVTNMNVALLIAVTLFCSAVQLLSAAGSRRDERATVLFGYFSLFQFAVLGLLLSGDLLTLFLFWELAGAGAFLLIGYAYQRKSVMKTALTMYLTTRLGSAAMLLSIIILFWHMPEHSLDFASLHNAVQGGASVLDGGLLTWIPLLLLLGAAGQGALLPLQVWSARAAADRSPVSFLPAVALPAGAIYLLARAYARFEASELAMQLTVYLGGLTALLAAAIAYAQPQTRKAIAYMVISQTGLAFMAFGLGSVTGGLFIAGANVLTLALMRLTFQRNERSRSRSSVWLVVIGALALAGFPPFVGYWSSILLLKSAYAQSFVWFAFGLLVLFLKAAAAARIALEALRGADRRRYLSDEPAPMHLSVLFTALCIAAGFVQTPWNGWLTVWLEGEAEPAGGYMAAAAAAFAAIALGGWLGIRYAGGLSKAKRLERLMRNELFIPAAFRYISRVPLRAVGRTLQAFDDYIVGRRLW